MFFLNENPFFSSVLGLVLVPAKSAPAALLPAELRNDGSRQLFGRYVDGQQEVRGRVGEAFVKMTAHQVAGLDG